MGGECKLESGQYLGEISALCFVHLPNSLPYLLAGTGSQVIFYDLVTGNMIRSFQVFKGIRVHGISCNFISCTEEKHSSKFVFKVAVFGERRVKLFNLHIELPIDSQNQTEVFVDLIFCHSLPKFSHWVLDAGFIKDRVITSLDGSQYLAVGCSDNSVHFWDILRSIISYEVKSPDRCLLYTMRMWGDKIETLHIASGTIYNEIIVWKVVCRYPAPGLNSPVKETLNIASSYGLELQLRIHQYEAVPVCRLAGHEGSIFRIAWSSDGSKLVSVSDDRSARIWEVDAETKGFDNAVEVVSYSTGPVLFGHSARVWDCCIYDSFIITVGEDCTCRVWGLDGTQLKMIKEHIGRGVWRCLYDPNSSLLVTAGFDSAIKVHQLHASLSTALEGCNEEVENSIDRKEIFTLHIPNSSKHIGLMDSKSEYVRCMHFAREDALYVATNNGFLYHAKISDTGDVQWTELFRVSQEVPIVCMNSLSGNISELPLCIEDWIALGDGKGRLTVVRVVGDVWTPKVETTFNWSAEIERQLLGTFWCKSLGHRFIFTADPRGRLKLWSSCDPPQSASQNTTRSSNVTLLAEFVSCFPIRIMCLDASFQEEVLVCGDLRGNLVLFPLLKDLLLGTPLASVAKISPLNYFKGAHGISSVCSVSITSSSSSEVEVRSTGADGCICYLEYDSCEQKLEFIGMRHVKELSLVRSFFPAVNRGNDLATGNYAIGFSSADFIIWNLSTETKVAQIPCGGWRRPHSYYLGDVPEMKNCFAFVKDEIIYVHKRWVLDSEKNMYPQNLHLQFHGREMHSLCFIFEDTQSSSNEKWAPFSQSGLIATACEDGTVRLTRYSPGVDNWSASELLGEHVGGSAVRSLCSLSKIHIIAVDMTNMSCGFYREATTLEDRENPFLLISVGAKRVVTAWKRKISLRNEKEEAVAVEPARGDGNNLYVSTGVSSSMSFQWLSSDMPTKNRSTNVKGVNKEKITETIEMNSDGASDSDPRENRTAALKVCQGDDYENDWRHLAVTAFLVKVADSKISVCFTVISCSDATVALRALVLPYRLWFDIALLVPLASPVLSLQHVIIPERLDFNNNNLQTGSLYIIITGSTDGSIAFWDLTETVETFMRRVSVLQKEDYRDSQRRPRTGRGSQGGRWWRSSGSSDLEQKPSDTLAEAKTIEKTEQNKQDQTPSKLTCDKMEVNTNGSLQEICKIWPLQVLNSVHQSGVNCLHVSAVNDSKGHESGFLYYVISGGDDQALHCLGFNLMMLPLSHYSERVTSERHCTAKSEILKNYSHYCRKQNYQIRFSYSDKIVSAHSSAIKGVWTDGNWVFSTGLDQRVRCWRVLVHGKLTENAHLIISVPEPEALDARACARNHYQIAVAGRGMQMVEFFAPGGIDDREADNF